MSRFSLEPRLLQVTIQMIDVTSVSVSVRPPYGKDDVNVEEEAAAAGAAAIVADEALRQAKRDRAAALVARQSAELAAREIDSLHVRSASLRQYLAAEVMPTVTDALLQMLRLRPDDPVIPRP